MQRQRGDAKRLRDAGDLDGIATGGIPAGPELERHRDDSTCASCHSKRDPPGFALESFDVMGGWRDRYRAVADDEASPEREVAAEALMRLFLEHQKLAS